MKLVELDPSLALRPDYGSGVSDRALALQNRTLADLSAGDLGFCIRQSIALKYTVPLVLDLAAEQPLRETDLYPGDLLASLFHAMKLGNLDNQQLGELRDICASAQAAAAILIGEVLPAVGAFIADYDEKISL